MDEPVAKSWKRTSVELPTSMIAQLENLRREWGLRHRGAVLERLLLQIFEGDGDEGLDGAGKGAAGDGGPLLGDFLDPGSTSDELAAIPPLFARAP